MNAAMLTGRFRLQRAFYPPLGSIGKKILTLRTELEPFAAHQGGPEIACGERTFFFAMALPTVQSSKQAEDFEVLAFVSGQPFRKFRVGYHAVFLPKHGDLQETTWSQSR